MQDFRTSPGGSSPRSFHSPLEFMSHHDCGPPELFGWPDPQFVKVKISLLSGSFQLPSFSSSDKRIQILTQLFALTIAAISLFSAKVDGKYRTPQTSSHMLFACLNVFSSFGLRKIIFFFVESTFLPMTFCDCKLHHAGAGDNIGIELAKSPRSPLAPGSPTGPGGPAGHVCVHHCVVILIDGSPDGFSETRLVIWVEQQRRPDLWVNKWLGQNAGINISHPLWPFRWAKVRSHGHHIYLPIEFDLTRPNPQWSFENTHFSYNRAWKLK